MLYLLIVVAKTIEVALATLRIKLITKGQRIFGALVGFVEIIMWILIVSTVLDDMHSDPLKALAYALGFALGNYFGIMVEEWIGIGSTKIEVILPKNQAQAVMKDIRSLGYGVTEIDGHGKDEKRSLLLVILPRKSVGKVQEVLEETQAFVTVTDIKPVYGGFGTIKK